MILCGAPGTCSCSAPSAHFASMLAARERGQAAPGEDQVFDFVFTYDREVIVECAQALMLRIAISAGPARAQ